MAEEHIHFASARSTTDDNAGIAPDASLVCVGGYVP